MSSRVAVTIVTFNSDRYIASCLEHVLAQDYPQLDVVVVENASSDRSADILRSFGYGLRVIYNAENRGFAGGQNQAIAAAREADWVLTLNPDVQLEKNFVSALVAAGERIADVGSVCGKLRAIRPDLTPFDRPLLDSTGIYFTPALRHFDRGNRAADSGQYEACEYVFGGTGAACLYRRRMIDDIAIENEFFDNDFFAYREDADVAWRAQLLGWKCVYTPEAVGFHVRTVVPENRGSLPAIINMHSVKNRWLMRIKNMTADLYLRHWVPIAVRDLMVIGGCLLREQTSLPAFPQVLKLFGKSWRKRRWIMARKRASDEYMAAWFGEQPVSFPVEPEIAR